MAGKTFLWLLLHHKIPHKTRHKSYSKYVKQIRTIATTELILGASLHNLLHHNIPAQCFFQKNAAVKVLSVCPKGVRVSVACVCVHGMYAALSLVSLHGCVPWLTSPSQCTHRKLVPAQASSVCLCSKNITSG